MNIKTTIAAIVVAGAGFATAACGTEQGAAAPAKINVERPAGGHETPTPGKDPKPTPDRLQYDQPGYGHPTRGHTSGCVVDPAGSRAAQRYVGDCGRDRYGNDRRSARK